MKAVVSLLTTECIITVATAAFANGGSYTATKIAYKSF